MSVRQCHCKLKKRESTIVLIIHYLNVIVASLLFFPDTFIIITSAGVLWQALCVCLSAYSGSI